MVVFTQFLEGPVSAVGYIGVKAFRAFVDHSRIEHHTHSDGSKDCADHNHNGKSDHTLGETAGRILYLIYIRGDLLTATYGKYQDG